MAFKNEVKKLAKNNKEVICHLNGFEYKGTIIAYEGQNPNDASLKMEIAYEDNGLMTAILPVNNSLVVMVPISDMTEDTTNEKVEYDEDDYNTWSIEELKQEMTKRKLAFSKKTVKKENLIEALELNDAEEAKELKEKLKKKRENKRKKKKK